MSRYVSIMRWRFFYYAVGGAYYAVHYPLATPSHGFTHPPNFGELSSTPAR